MPRWRSSRGRLWGWFNLVSLYIKKPFTFRSFFLRFSRWKRSSWSRKSGGLSIGLGAINASTKQSVFRSAKNSILMRKPHLTSRRKTSNGPNKSLLEHVKEKYDFVWNAATFRLDDDADSVNFGDLVVSPPPSGNSSINFQIGLHLSYMLFPNSSKVSSLKP